jgi:ubiquinol-cytochrome c reductase cytochrome b/c1 subunit
VVTGIVLAMHYCPDTTLAYSSIEHIMRDINYGWVFRYLHLNGASLFFLAVYLHILRGLYQQSFHSPRELLWLSGMVIFVLMMATAFMGYVLPWGQMSFWGATVITNLFTTIPYVGDSFVNWLWGGFSVDNPTLNRFFSLHYLLPFVLIGLVGVHLALLHKNGSTAPVVKGGNFERTNFYPYFYVKDLVVFFFFLTLFAVLVSFYPTVLGDSDNEIMANNWVTPRHIVPEWYFLPYYAILRLIPNKVLGVLFMAGSLVVFFVLSYLWLLGEEDRVVPVEGSAKFRSLYQVLLLLFFFDNLTLGWVGANSIQTYFVWVGQLALVYYFVFLLVILPFML